MGAFLHRTSKRYLVSTSPNSLPEPIANYIEGPDLSAVADQPKKYWIITGDIVTLLEPQSARDAVDAAELIVKRDSVVAQLDQVENVLRAFMLVVMDEINILRDQHGLADRTVPQLRTASRNKLGS